MAEEGRHVDILLVEDNEADVGLTVAAFRDAVVQARVHAVRDGDDAISFLKNAEHHTKAPRPDLIVLDLNLPGMDGFQVLETIKADPKLKSIPVIVMAGSDRQEDQARAYRLQIAAYIVKPADKDKYFAAIRSIKELWFHNVVSPPKENGTAV